MYYNSSSYAIDLTAYILSTFGVDISQARRASAPKRARISRPADDAESSAAGKAAAQKALAGKAATRKADARGAVAYFMISVQTIVNYI